MDKAATEEVRGGGKHYTPQGQSGIDKDLCDVPVQWIHPLLFAWMNLLTIPYFIALGMLLGPSSHIQSNVWKRSGRAWLRSWRMKPRFTRFRKISISLQNHLSDRQLKSETRIEAGTPNHRNGNGSFGHTLGQGNFGT